MEGKLSLDQVRKYSSEFTASVSASFFRSQNRISGTEILKLTPVHQVNLFVIRELMLLWESEKSKLESPYFDYTAKEVQDALISFQNTLSNHISISKMEFEPLLEKAVYDTLILVFSPYDYYADLLDTQGKGKIRISNLKTGVRYLRINRLPMEKMVSEIEATSSIPFVSSKEAFSVLDKILETTRFQPENSETFIEQFSTVRPFKKDQFFEADTETRSTILTSENKSLLNKSDDASTTRLYDEVEQDNRPTLANNFLKQKIERLKDNLSINQKFMFTKILFNGDINLFSEAIDRFDQMHSIEEAMAYISKNHPEWQKDSEEFGEFQLLLEKRFSGL